MSDQPEIPVKELAHEELREVWSRCRSPNWDGDGALPISADTLRNAHRFLEAIPPEYPLPSISAEPDDHLELEWYQATDWLLSVSVSSDGMLYWAALLGEEDPRGRCRFDGEVSETILELIRRVRAPRPEQLQ